MNTLQLIGRKGDLCSNIRVGLLSLQRLTGFFGQVLADTGQQQGAARPRARRSSTISSR